MLHNSLKKGMVYTLSHENIHGEMFVVSDVVNYIEWVMS